MNKMHLVLVLALFSLPCGCGRSGEFEKRPYLQAPSRRAVTLMWTTRKPGPFTVRCETEGEPARTTRTRAEIETVEFLPAPESTEGAVEIAPPVKEYVYAVQLRNLSPGKRYAYRVESGAVAAEGTFLTHPAKERAFTFIAYGDSRTQAEVHRKVVSCFAQHRPAFVVHTGDFVTTGAFREWGREFFAPLADVIRNVPVWPARGNHEGSEVFRQCFSLPGKELWYSFDYANAHFVCLDSGTGGADRAEMLAWCERDLAKSKARWKFVYHHHPSYDVGSHHTRWGRGDFVPLFRKHGVDVVFSGHSHSYQRFYPMITPGENDAHPITYVTCAGGGAPLHRVEMDPHCAVGAHKYHYVVLRVDGDVLTARALTPEGDEIDAFTIRKPEGVHEKAYLASALPESSFGETSRLLFASLRRGFTLSEYPTPERAGVAEIELRLGRFVTDEETGEKSYVPAKAGMKYEIRLELRAAKAYELAAPVRGELAPGETKKVAVAIRAKKGAKVGASEWSGTLWPILRLECVYEIEGKRGSVFSGRFYAPVAETPFRRAAAAEKSRCDELVAAEKMTADEAARRKKQIDRLLKLAKEKMVPILKKDDEGWKLLEEIKASKDVEARLEALEAALKARDAEPPLPAAKKPAA